ncbi:MAG TPA: helix-turn-helix domain-containing protein [Pirellulaceae bacterium]|nr:helix-turn-helix domain-containing protein [Pirellulaceae bacterium]
MSVRSFLTIRQFADRIITSPDRIRDLIDSGDLRAVNIGKPGARRKTWRIPADEVERWLDSRASRPPAKPQPRERKRAAAYIPQYL